MPNDDNAFFIFVRSCSERGVVSGPHGQPQGPGGGRRPLLLLLHQGKPARLQAHLVAQCECGEQSAL